MEKVKNNLIVVMLLSVILGLGGGFVGSIVVRSYVIGNDFGLPFFSDINLSEGGYNGSSLIITGAKKVVVEQNDKIVETIDSARSNLVGIYKKNLLAIDAREEDDFNLGNYYKIGQEVAEGLIITSDGWIITDKKLDSFNYVVITNDKHIYSIDKILYDSLTSFYFLHVPARDFPVKKFVGNNDTRNGEIALIINSAGESIITSIKDSNNKEISYLNFSDSFSKNIILADDFSNDFRGLALFNLSGDIIGLQRADGSVEPMSHFGSAIESLLEDDKIKRPSLGINYIDLSRLVGAISTSDGEGSYSKGAVIYYSTSGVAVVRGSVADIAGLQAGDIIIKVDNIIIDEDHDLAETLQSFSVDDNINITFLRDGVEVRVDVQLGEIE